MSEVAGSCRVATVSGTKAASVDHCDASELQVSFSIRMCTHKSAPCLVRAECKFQSEDVQCLVKSTAVTLALGVAH